ERPLPLLDRLARDLAADRAHDEIAFHRVPRRPDRLRRDEERRHRSLVIDDAVAIDAVALDPGRVVELVEWVPRGPHRVRAERRVEMGVEDQAVSPTRSVDPGRDVEALGDHGVLLRREAVLAEPLVYELAGGSLAPGRTVDVPEREREVHDLFRIDQLEDVVWSHAALPPWTGTANRATADAMSSIATDTRIAAWAFARSITAASRTGPALGRHDLGEQRRLRAREEVAESDERGRGEERQEVVREEEDEIADRDGGEAGRDD